MWRATARHARASEVRDCCCWRDVRGWKRNWQSASKRDARFESKRAARAHSPRGGVHASNDEIRRHAERRQATAERRRCAAARPAARPRAACTRWWRAAAGATTRRRPSPRPSAAPAWRQHSSPRRPRASGCRRRSSVLRSSGVRPLSNVKAIWRLPTNSSASTTASWLRVARRSRSPHAAARAAARAAQHARDVLRLALHRQLEAPHRLRHLAPLLRAAAARASFTAVRASDDGCASDG
jgi:hypothetical protein